MDIVSHVLAPLFGPEIHYDEVDGSTLSGEVAYQELCQWLCERNHHGLAETVQQAMNRRLGGVLCS